jgi:hypothetical protein
LIVRAVAVFMLFIPCRPIAMIRVDGTKEVWKADGKMLIVGMKEKTDKGRGCSELVIREIAKKNSCPLTL